MNVKQGDMAIVIKSRMYPETLGLIVEVTKFLGEDDNLWGCVTQRPVRIKDKFTGEWGKTHRLAIPDAHLRPISGLPDEDDIDESKPVDHKEELTV